MAWLKKKPDPLSDRARALNQEIAHLEGQIKRLGAQLDRDQAHPRLRPTSLPHASNAGRAGASTAPASPPAAAAHEPIFEDVDQGRLESGDPSVVPREHYNELGVRKYDLPGLLRRIRGFFQGPSATNPKLVSYLAAGGIQGLRPLRYETRKQRRRVIAFAGLVFLLLLGTILELLHRHQ
jgi:hypothetical protein